MAWRLARSLQVLESEVQQVAPGTTVWTIGDESHRGTASDHNPNEAEVVCASDTLGNAGLDLGWYAETVRRAGIDGHPAPKYVIYNRRIASRSRGWIWRPYSGSNPHTGHVHVSVGVGPDGQSTGPYDDESPWGLLEEDDMDQGDIVRHTKYNVAFHLRNTLRGVDQATEQLAEVRATLRVLAGEDQATVIREELDRHRGVLLAVLAETLGEQVLAGLREQLGDVADERLVAAAEAGGTNRTDGALDEPA